MGIATTAILGIAGTLFGGYAQYQQANAQAEAAEYNAQVAERNAALNESQARQASERGALEEYNLRKKYQDLQSAQKIATAYSGTTFGGSNMDIMAGSAYEAEMDAAMIRYNTMNERYAYEVQAANNYEQANINRAQAANYKKAGRMGIFNTILGTATQLSDSLYSNDSAANKNAIPKRSSRFKQSVGYQYKQVNPYGR